jgi:serine/threonine-protein kinase
MKALAKEREARYQSAREVQSALEDFVRRERIPVSNVALTQYMQSLFEEKLLAQKEQILQGKQLADIIDLQQPLETTGQHDVDPSLRLSSSVLSAPSAARTVTEIRVVKRTSPVTVTAFAAVITVAIATSVYGWRLHRKALADAAAVSVVSSMPVVPVNRGSISVSTDPPGASIWIDGEMRSEVTPAEIKQLPTGRDFEVKMSKEGFEALKKTVTLSDAEPSAKWDAPLSKGSVTLDLAVKPSPAGLALVLDGKPLAGINTTGVTSGDQHKLVVGAPGYADQTFTFIAAPQETKHFDVALVKETHRTHVASSGGATPAPGPVGNGKLNVGASPGWCNVSVDGVARGPTPLAGLELSAGSHRVVCAPPDHPAMSTTVAVAADGTTRYRFALPQ